MITIYEKSTGIKKAYLDSCIDKDSVSVTRAVNGETTARFDCIPTQGVNVGELLAAPSYVDIDGDLFDVAYVEQSHSAGIVYSVSCEHVIYRLADRELIQYSHEGQPISILSEILEGSGFSAGIVEFNGHFTFVETESEHILDHLRRFAAALGARLTYDGFSVNLRGNLRVNRGFEVRLGKNAVSVRKIIDRRKDLIYYQASIADLARSPLYEELQDLEKAVEGDTIRVIDDQLGIDAEQCVITRTYNPIGGNNLSLEIANRLELFTDSFILLERNALLQGRKYYGVSINKKYGLKIYREDGSSETVFNSDSWYVEVGGRRVLYADYTSNPPKFVFNGEFGADVVIAQEIITQNFYADNGVVANLTVDALRTDYERAMKYLNSDMTPINYIMIDNEEYRMITAETDGSETEHFKNANGEPMYWRDGETGGTMTVENTGSPVTVYVYNEAVKFSNSFQEITWNGGGSRGPVMVFGQGTGVGENGKGFIYKDAFSFRIKYVTNEGVTTELYAENDGKWYYNGSEICTGGTPVDPEYDMFTFNNTQGELSSEGQWELKAPIIFNNLLEHSATSADNNVYVLGGQSGLANTIRYTSVYDTETDSWERLADLPNVTYGIAAVTVNGIVYSMGGSPGSYVVAPCYSYNPATNMWTQIASPDVGHIGGAAVEISGLIYAIGYNGKLYTRDHVFSTDVYDPVSNTWTARKTAPARIGRCAAGVVDGTIYVFGGDPDPYEYTHAYNPVTDTWSQKANSAIVFTSGVVFRPSAAVMGGKVFVFAPSAYADGAQVYDPVTNTWSSQPLLSNRGSAPVAAAVGNAIYVIGGGVTLNEALVFGSYMFSFQIQIGDIVQFTSDIIIGGWQSVPANTATTAQTAGTLVSTSPKLTGVVKRRKETL